MVVAGCPGGSGLTVCDQQPDITGSWTFTLDAPDGAGASDLPRPMQITADLLQVKSENALGLGAPVWGTLRSRDPGLFESLEIPKLRLNNGSKTGAVLGCTLKINIPVASPVTDDNTDQGPLRLALSGKIVARGLIEGQTSTVILEEDAAMLPRMFLWTGTQP